jgi:hypothetical protein
MKDINQDAFILTRTYPGQYSLFAISAVSGQLPAGPAFTFKTDSI